MLCLILKPIAHKLSLVDVPNARKNHRNATPLIGGMCIFVACGLSLFIFGDMQGRDLRPLFVAASLFLVLGVVDDQFDVKAYHNQVLNSGSLPLILLEQKIDTWIASQLGE